MGQVPATSVMPNTTYDNPMPMGGPPSEHGDNISHAASE